MERALDADLIANLRESLEQRDDRLTGLGGELEAAECEKEEIVERLMAAKAEAKSLRSAATRARLRGLLPYQVGIVVSIAAAAFAVASLAIPDRSGTARAGAALQKEDAVVVPRGQAASSDDQAVAVRAINIWLEAIRTRQSEQVAALYAPAFSSELYPTRSALLDSLANSVPATDAIEAEMAALIVLRDGDDLELSVPIRRRSGPHIEIGARRFRLTESRGHWRIVSESWAPLH